MWYIRENGVAETISSLTENLIAKNFEHQLIIKLIKFIKKK